MEFDDIKNTWKNSFKEEELLNQEEINARLNIKSKSNTALNKVKRNYRLEIYGSGILIIYAIYWLNKNIATNNKYLIIGISMLFFGALFFYAAYNYYKVKNKVISDDQVKPALKETIRDIERYVNFSRSNFTKFILFPFTILFGMFLGLSVGTAEKEIIEMIKLLQGDVVIKLIIGFVVASIAMVPVSLYVNKKMYKQHLDELKSCLKEFEQMETEE